MSEYRILPWKEENHSTRYHIITLNEDGALVSPEWMPTKQMAETRVACLTWNDAMYASEEWHNGRMNKYYFRDLLRQITGLTLDITERPNEEESTRYHINVCGDVWLTYNIYGMWVEYAYFS